MPIHSSGFKGLEINSPDDYEGRFRMGRMCLPLHGDGVKPKALALQCEDDRQPVTGNFRGQGWDSLYHPRLCDRGM